MFKHTRLKKLEQRHLKKRSKIEVVVEHQICLMLNRNITEQSVCTVHRSYNCSAGSIWCMELRSTGLHGASQ
jgi:hypothetical protein